MNPNESGDTLRRFISERARRTVTPSRRCLYIFDIPDISPDIADTMTRWTNPIIREGVLANSQLETAGGVDRLDIGDIAGYMEAFYAGMDVKIMRHHFCFNVWREGRGGVVGAAERGHVALTAPDGSATRIRYRPSKDGATKGQLNLNDMLDALHASLPRDGFAALLVTDHDLYEDEEDDFCAGRAYGGSGICITSTFRYHPALDRLASVNYAHSWPASHCRDYVDDCWEATEPGLKDTEYGQARRTKRGRAKLDPACMLSIKQSPQTALGAAVLATSGIMIPRTRQEWTGLWLARVCRTSSHELGHCVGIGHCLNYSCAMQGTTCIAEDMRQPPYLCPICLKMVAYSLVGETVMKARGTERLKKAAAAEDSWTKESYEKMRAYCRQRQDIGMFAGFAGWLDVRLAELDAIAQRDDEQEREDTVMSDDSSLIFLGATRR